MTADLSEDSIHDDPVSKAIRLMVHVCLALLVVILVVLACLEVSGVSL